MSISWFRYIYKIGHAAIVFKTITPKVRSVYFSSYKIIARKNDTVELCKSRKRVKKIVIKSEEKYGDCIVIGKSGLFILFNQAFLGKWPHN